jgi:hypothetical protein
MGVDEIKYFVLMSMNALPEIDVKITTDDNILLHDRVDSVSENKCSTEFEGELRGQ